MRRGWKIFWAVCGICAAVGLIFCVISVALGVSIEAVEERFPDGFSFPVRIGNFIYDDDDYENGTDTDVIRGDDTQKYQDVKSIDLYVCAGTIEIRKAEKGVSDVLIRTKDIDSRLKLRYYMDGSTLTVRTKKSIRGVSHVGSVGEIYLYVPENYLFDEVDLEVRAGTLFAETINAKELSVNVGAGEADITDFTAEEIDFDCGTGELKAAGEIRKEADLECGIGQITFTAKGNEEDYNYDISCGIGEVVCGDSTYSGIASGKKMDNGAAKEMDIECGIGQVTVNFM